MRDVFRRIIIRFLPKLSKNNNRAQSYRSKQLTFLLLTAAEPSEIHCNKLSNSSVVY
jgi:hypothetical protein